ncbi:hypothetical protein WJX79_000718 [Trebouxia sp. C0005]
MSGGLHLSHKLDFSAVAFASERQSLLLASLAAPQITGRSNRPPIDLVAVLDRSGSMRGAKLTSVKDTSDFLVQQMSAEDRLSIVTFESKVRVDYPLQNMSSSSKEAAQKVISRIKAGGGTNLSGGLFKGIDQHQQGVAAEGAPAEQASASEGSSSARSERIRSLFLFTDGQATTGVTNTPQLMSVISVMLENPIRPTIHCFGFGETYDSACLDSICQAGQGQSYFVEDAESIPGALSSALGGLMSMAAQNVELTFTPKEGVVIKSVDTAFPTSSQDGAFKVTVGDLYAEERKDFLVKFAVGAVQEAVDSQEVLDVSVRCLDLSLGTMKENSTSAVMCRPAKVPHDVLMDSKVQEAVYRLDTAKVIKDAVRIADAGDLPEARRMLTGQLSQLPASSTSSMLPLDQSVSTEPRQLSLLQVQKCMLQYWIRIHSCQVPDRDSPGVDHKFPHQQLLQQRNGKTLRRRMACTTYICLALRKS